MWKDEENSVFFSISFILLVGNCIKKNNNNYKNVENFREVYQLKEIVIALSIGEALIKAYLLELWLNLAISLAIHVSFNYIFMNYWKHQSIKNNLR